MLTFLITGCAAKESMENSKNEEINAKISFTDDLDKKINMNEKATRIISLYSAHTENLFALGLDKEIIGVGKTDAYPPKVKEKEVFDYRSDPEKVIAAEPDVVLIRPFIKRSKPEFVEALEKAKINVVCLYPDKFEEFPEYIKKLALLTGKEEKAQELLEKFNSDLEEIKELTSNIDNKVKVYFESTQNEYRTITTDSMPAHAISFAGGENIAKDATAMKEGTSIASYGAEKILEKGEDIDVFVSQTGAMNSGGNPHSIRIRPGFDTIKAVKEGKVYVINEKLVSSPTFRFSKGVRELARMFYPEVLDDLKVYGEKDTITREDMAKIAVMFKHKGIFSPTSKYYTKKHTGHVYGGFCDVLVNHPNFDYIETAVLSGYIDGEGEHFYPERELTREELAKTLYMLTDLSNNEKRLVISDLDKCMKPQIIEMVVKNDLMELENKAFNPQKIVTGKEVLKALAKIQTNS